MCISLKHSIFNRYRSEFELVRFSGVSYTGSHFGTINTSDAKLTILKRRPTPFSPEFKLESDFHSFNSTLQVPFRFLSHQSLTIPLISFKAKLRNHPLGFGLFAN
jgi:hypothetical protein